MKNTSKSLWHKPEMIVLVRSNPEEAVLTGCKTATGGGPQAGGSANQCTGQAGCAAIQGS